MKQKATTNTLLALFPFILAKLVINSMLKIFMITFMKRFNFYGGYQTY